MGVILILDGPEKAGKSTLAKRLQSEFGATIRKWGLITHDKVYAEAMAEDVQLDHPVIWDRSFASEHVYDILTDRGRHLGRDPWHGEWMYGRAPQSFGAKIILLGPSTDTLARLRDETDMPVDPEDERNLFAEYGFRFGWSVFENQHDAASLDAIVHSVKRTLLFQDEAQVPPPPVYCGPLHPRVLVVGEARNHNAARSWPGAWLPFTSRYSTEYGRLLGDAAFDVGWANADDCPIDFAKKASVLVACGAVATTWATKIVKHGHVENIPHPSWLYRWGDAKAAQATTIKLLREVVGV